MSVSPKTPDAGGVAELRRLYERADRFAREIAGFRKLRTALEKLEASRDDLNAKSMAEVRKSRRFALQLTLAVLGIVTTAVLGIWRIVTAT